MNESADPRTPAPASAARFPTGWLWLLAGSQILFLIHAYRLFSEQGRFPAPLFYEPSDTFMDFYNTNYWSFNWGRYEIWKSVYPIFSFLLGRLLGSADCATVGPFQMRACEPYAAWPLLAAYLVGSYLCTRLLLPRLESKAVPRWMLAVLVYFCILFCLPGLFAVERGNYILVTFACVAGAAYWKSDWRGALLLAVAINLKQYLLVLWLAAFIKRKFGWLAISVCAAFAMNLLGMLLVPETHYGQIVENLVGFSSGESLSYFEKLWYSTSFSSWIRTLDYSPQVGGRLWGYQFDIAYVVVQYLRWGSLACATVCCVAASARFRTVSEGYIAFCFLLALLIATESPGGYAIMLLVPFLAGVLERRQLVWIPWIMLLLLTPLDYGIGPSLAFKHPSYFTGQLIETEPALTAGSYLRPMLLAAMSLYLLVDLIRTAGAARVESSRLPSRPASSWRTIGELIFE